MGSQNGNALWFILIAVALLGILTVSMTRSGGNSNETGSYEQNQITANDILGYASSIEQAVQSLLARGCSENDISFWYDSDGNGTEDGSDDYYNANSPTDHSCHIFQPEGAGMAYLPPSNNWLDATQNAQARFGEIIFSSGQKVINLETTGNELILFIPYVPLGICQAVNRVAGINTTPAIDTFTETLFTGAYTDSATPDIGDEDTSLENQTSFCNAHAAGGHYSVVKVLHAR